MRLIKRMIVAMFAKSPLVTRVSDSSDPAIAKIRSKMVADLVERLESPRSGQ